jgi:Flp pilus assembly pilin Flp
MRQRIRRRMAEERGAATAEYAIVTLATVGA